MDLSPPPESAAGSSSSWTGLIKSAAERLLPLVITAGSLIGFVAFAGAVIVWTRFEALNVPPDQAVKAVPREELVAAGSSFLLIFGFFGVLAVLAAYLVDRSGRATPGMARCLLVLLAVEGIASIVLAEGLSLGRTLGSVGLLLFLLLVAFLATFVPPLTRLEDELPARRRERLAPRKAAFHFESRVAEEKKKEGKKESAVSPYWYEKRDTVRIAVPLTIGVVLAAALIFAAPSGKFLAAGVVALVFVAIWVAIRLQPILKKLRARHTEHRTVGEREERVAPPRRRRPDLPLHRPLRFFLKPTGMGVMWALMLAVIALPAVSLKQWWLALSLAAAALLAGGLWRIAALTGVRFVWFGLSVFISVPLFGTLTLMARNLAHPQVQPMALIRKTDGPYEAIQGLYVTEGNDRIYFANVGTEGCSDNLTPAGGRLLWVPKSEVVTMSLGPSQDVESAAKSALEMSYALTPGVETPAGDHVGLTIGEKRALADAGASTPTGRDRRLEDAGPAIRPNFGAGLTLSPEEAAPGEVVTLHMSAPNDDVEGFGRIRGGRTLRVGGVRVDIFKERSREADRAEYMETASGQLLRLAKREPYVRIEEPGPDPGAEFEPLPEGGAPKSDLYLKLVDKSVQAVSEGDLALTKFDGGFFLRLDSGAGPPKLAAATVTVERKGEPSVRLEPHPLTQAWYENRIRFKVPENATSGPVSVECNQLEGQPLLRVSLPPTARIGVSLQAGSERVHFDSRRSVDEDGKIRSRKWTVGGYPAGHLSSMTLELPPRLTPYRVRLAITDSEGETGTAELQLLRLPGRSVAFEGSGEKGNGRSGGVTALTPKHRKLFDAIRHSFLRAARIEQPVEIDIDGSANDSEKSSTDMRRAMRRARRVERKLTHRVTSALATASSGRSVVGHPRGVPIPVKVHAYGGSCPIFASPENPGNRRIEIFMLGEGATLLPSPGCRLGRHDESEWVPPPP